MGMPADSETLGRLTEFLTSEYPIPPWYNNNARLRMEQRKQEGHSLDLGVLAWGDTGPKALTYFAKSTGEIEYAQPQSVFFPISFQQRKKITDPELGQEVTKMLEGQNSLCVHLYSRWLRKFSKGMPGQRPRPSSWLGSYLKAEGLVDYDALKAEEHSRKKPSDRQKLEKINASEFFDDLNQRWTSLLTLRNSSPHGRVTAVTMAKDEGPYILEWVAHHHLLGFTDILVYTNDCSDGTAEMFDALHSIGVVSHYNNSELGSKPPQSRALIRAGQHPLVEEADWVMVFDLDEFVAIRHEGGKIDHLIDVVKEKGATGMALTWRFFGSSGNTLHEGTPVTERFQHAAGDDFTMGFGIKTLFKTDDRLRLAIHRPRIKRHKKQDSNPFELNWVNGSAQPVDGKVMTWKQTRKTVGYDLAQVNHYGVKSREEYLMRRLRGDVLNNHDKYNADYFRKFDRNDVKDDTALRFSKERSALVNRFLEFPAVREADELIKHRYAEKLEQLRNADNYSSMLEELSVIGDNT